MRTWLGVTVWGAILLSFAACGEDSPEEKLEKACQDFCDAAFGIGCDFEGLDEGTCKTACGQLDAQLQGQCVAEYTAVFRCGADGGFTCSEFGPIPNNACIEETQAFNTCTQGAVCDDFCNDTAAAGCAPSGNASACVSECEATRAQLDNCSFDYEDYLSCMTTFADIACVDGVPRSIDCDEDLLDVGDCIASFEGNPCAGLCFATDALGCGDELDCVVGCEAERSDASNCTFEHDRWVDCMLRQWEPTCSGGALADNECTFERDDFESCASPG